MPDAWGNSSTTPQIISSDAATLAGGFITAVTANIVYLYAFELSMTVVVVGTRYRNGAAPTGSSNMGIYTAAGAIIPTSDTGAILDVASSIASFTYPTPISLLPGQYFIAFSCNAGDSFQGLSPQDTALSRAKRASNALAAGALPATLGAIQVTTSFAPAMALLVSGGLL